MNTPNERNPPGEVGSENASLIGRLHGYSSARQRPRKGTARANVLAALRAGQRLTSLDAWRAFGTSRLAADIHELRRMGWPIEAETLEASTRADRHSRIARYYLPEVGGGDA